jgi:tRNA(Ile)-lysidine synthase
LKPGAVPAPSADPCALASRLEALAGEERRRYVVALSGGADSAALLACLVAPGGVGLERLRALHVDHGLAGSPALREAAEAIAATLGVALRIVRVHVDPHPAQGIEAAARAVRLAAFAADLAADEDLLTAHHAEDQAETLLLQLLRGSGLPGLAAMPLVQPCGAGRLVRPWLDLPRARLRGFLDGRALAWCEDPMNAETHYDRVYLRNEVWPLLTARWPAAAKTLARSAEHIAAAQSLLDRSSAAQLPAFVRGAGLDGQALMAEPAAVRRELLRHWLHSRGYPAPSTARLEAIERLLGAGPSATPRVVYGRLELRRHDGVLYAFEQLAPLAIPTGTTFDGAPARIDLGPLGRVEVVTGGVGDLVCRPGVVFTVGERVGGERLQRDRDGPRRPLKDWLREAGVPAWLRERALVIRAEGAPVAVVLPQGTFVAAEARAEPGEAAIRFRWTRAPEGLIGSAFVEPMEPFR